MTDVMNRTVLRELQPAGGTRYHQPFICTQCPLRWMGDAPHTADGGEGGHVAGEGQ